MLSREWVFFIWQSPIMTQHVVLHEVLVVNRSAKLCQLMCLFEGMLRASQMYTLALHKIPAQNRFAASIAASKYRRRPRPYSFFLDLT